MECEHFQEDLPDLLYGELPEERRTWAEEHARGCADCQGLWQELRAVRGALPPLAAPTHLQDRLKLAARDELLTRAPGGRTPGRGGALQLVAATILAACVTLAGFALGVAYERRRAPAPAPRLEQRASDPPAPGEPPWIEVNAPSPPGLRLSPTPQPPEAWQRVLHDAACERLRTGDLRAAREFFLRAAQMAPTSPVAAAAELGAAEAALRLGEAEQARRELDLLQQRIRAGVRVGDAALLQRAAELAQEAAEAQER